MVTAEPKEGKRIRYKTDHVQIDMVVYPGERDPDIIWLRGGRGLTLSKLKAGILELEFQYTLSKLNSYV